MPKSLDENSYIDRIEKIAKKHGYLLKKVAPITEDFQYHMFVEVYQPIAGYKYQIMEWIVEEDYAFYEPHNTGYFAYPNEVDALPDAFDCAMDMEIPFRYKQTFWIITRKEATNGKE